MAERALPAHLGLEPALHRAAPVAQAARRAQAGSPARGGGPVPEPHRPRGGRAPAPAAGHGCRARHRDDAGDRRRRAPGRGLVSGARRRIRRAARGARGYERRGLRRHLRCGCGDDHARRARLRLGPAGAAAARRGGPAPRGRSGGLLDDRVAARADGRVEGPRRRLLLHPARHRQRDQLGPARAGGSAALPGAHDQHVAARPGAHRPRAGPAGEGARLLELESRGDRARPGTGAGGAAA